MTGLATHPAATDLQDTLHTLILDTPGLTGALLASADGLPLADVLRDAGAPGVAAMAATAAGLGQRIVDDLQFGEFAECVVRASDGYLSVYRVGTTAVLAVLATADANLGRIHLQARRCAAAVLAQIA